MSKKLEGYKPQWDPKVFDGPPPDQEFKEVVRCETCGELANFLFRTDQKWYDCDCSIILSEKDIYTMYQCSLCLEEHETEECNCYE